MAMAGAAGVQGAGWGGAFSGGIKQECRGLCFGGGALN